MKKIVVALSLLVLTFSLFGQTTALEIRKQAFEQETIQDAIVYINEALVNVESPKEKRSTLYLLGSLQEQLGLYTDASRSYAKACGISAPDAEGVKKCTTEQMVLNAVRCCLCAGEIETAEKYLNSAVRLSKDETILAYVNLYSVWAQLSKSQTFEDNSDSIALLTAYASMSSMEVVKPQVLFTLWYLTQQDEFKTKLIKLYPSSTEAGICNGKVQIASVPFWYFVPRQ